MIKHTIKRFFTLALALALFGMSACKNASDSADAGVTPWTAELTLSSEKPVIKVKVTTDDGTPVTVKGCTETELKSGIETALNAKGTKVTLTGKITELNCDSDTLTVLNVQGGLTALQSLSCNENQLTALNVQGCIALHSLSCNKNRLADLNVQGCTALQNLSCEENQLTALNVQGCTALQTLRCSENQLAVLNVQGCTALSWLGCTGNKLTALNVKDFTALGMLSCAKNQLTDLNVQGCTALGYLDCFGNKLDATALTRILTALPVHDGGQCTLYTDQSGVEGNHKDFTNPPTLKQAFEEAKTEKKWNMKKYGTDGSTMVNI